MKINYLLLSSLLFLSINLSAQVNPHAIGLRLNGDGYGNGAEISYQHGFGDKNRLELDLGGRSHKNWGHVGLYAGYHWVWNLTQGLNWYIGPGAAIGSYRSRYDKNDPYYENGITLAIGGQIGIEYDFSSHGAPILLSLDARPLWDVFYYYDYNRYDHFGYNAALSIRYVF